MARKAKKAKRVSSSRPSSALAKRVKQLEGWADTMRDGIEALQHRIERLEVGHNGDAAAHAALAPQAPAEPADASAETEA